MTHGLAKTPSGFQTVDLLRLKAVLVKLLDDAIVENGSQQFDLDHDFYWKIEFPNEFDVNAIPTLPDGVGSLHTDWEMTHWLADEPSRVSAYALTEVGPLLNYIGNRLARRERPGDPIASQ